MMNFTFSRHISAGRGVLAAVLAGIGMGASAQSMQVLEDYALNDSVACEVMVEAVSPNHKYVAGRCFSYEAMVYGSFIKNLETDETLFMADDPSGFGGSLSAVTDEGLGIGSNNGALTITMDSTVTKLPVPADTESFATDASDDASVIVGYNRSTLDYMSHACVWVNGEMVALPEPAEADLGNAAATSEAHHTTADGGIIAGVVYDAMYTPFLTVWKKQADGTYAYDVVGRRYYSMDGEDPERPYVYFMPMDISRNGKYVALTTQLADGTQAMARLDLEADKLEVCASSVISEAVAVADDGTVIGTAFYGGTWSMTSRCALWKAGETELQILSTLSPEYADLAAFDEAGAVYVRDITPDGLCVVGYAYEQGFITKSYVVDLTGIGTGINSAAAAAGATEKARHTLDGIRVNAPAKGLNIVKMSDGTTVKVMVK